MNSPRTLIAPLVTFAALGLGAATLAHRSPAADMAAAARSFLESLTPELRAKAMVAFDDKARTDWHFVPRTRPGVTLGAMSDSQRAAARDLFRSALSSRGVLKVEQIIALESILRVVDKGTPDEALRDPDAYTVTVYGAPGSAAPWGWKVEGHHVSLNFTIGADGQVRALPSFLGASPARVRNGPGAGMRVLALEEDLARQLVRSLDDSQRKEAVIAETPPAGILTGPGRDLGAATTVGLTHAAMTAAQRATLLRLIEEYAHSLRHDLASGEMDRIHAAGLDAVKFAWAGGMDAGRPHYYRITGPTFVIEYDNTQNSANHIHTVWHDRERDFGRDLLKEHYHHDHK